VRSAPLEPGFTAKVRQAIVPALLERAVQQLLEHHDAPPAVYPQIRLAASERWLDEVEAVPFSCIDLQNCQPAEQNCPEATAAELQASLNLAEGPLLRVALLDLGDNQPNRLLVIHH